jgi:phage-related protein
VTESEKKQSKQLKWVGSSKKDLSEFPEEARFEMGFALYTAQLGETHESAKMFKGHGSGVYEIVSDHDKNAYRAIYVVNIGDAIYVLHAFQKKSKKGIATPKEEIAVIDARLKQLKQTLKEKG